MPLFLLETRRDLVKKALTAALLSLGLFSSCLGPNRAFNQLHEWNQGASDERWAREGIFVVFHIVPVYPVAYVADVLVLNSIEWWGGKNPLDE